MRLAWSWTSSPDDDYHDILSSEALGCFYNSIIECYSSTMVNRLSGLYRKAESWHCCVVLTCKFRTMPHWKLFLVD